MTWNEDHERIIAASELGDATPHVAVDLLVAARKRAFDAEQKAQQLQTELDARKAVHGWIKTSERMPRSHESVLGVDGQGDVSEVRHFVNDIWSYADSNRQVDGPITYWMPLPEPPK